MMQNKKPIIQNDYYVNCLKKNYIAFVLILFFFCFLCYRYILMKYYRNEYNEELEDVEFKKNKIIELLLQSTEVKKKYKEPQKNIKLPQEFNSTFSNYSYI